MDLISIVVPIYNSELYLRECLNSILKQTYSNLQIILINDGSKDASKDICDEFASQDSRIEVYHKTNTGVSDSRNLGINKSIGKFICFVDSDDVIGDALIDKLHENIISQSTDLSIIGHEIVSNIDSTYDNKIKKVPSKFTGKTKLFLENIAYYLEQHSVQGPCAKLFRTSIIKKNNIIFPESMSFGEDTVFVYKYIEHTKCISTIPEIAYSYRRINVDSLSSKININQIDIYLLLYKKLMELLLKFDVDNSDVVENGICVAALSCINDIYTSNFPHSRIQRQSYLEYIVRTEKVLESFHKQKNKKYKYKIFSLLMKLDINNMDKLLFLYFKLR